MLEENERARLVKAALGARKNAYAPYSRYYVGAAVLCADGTMFTGCNIENSSYPCGICAERTAAAKAVSEGHRDITAVAVAGSAEDFCTPCGVCRQFLYELAPGMTVLCCRDNGEHKEFTLDNLLPEGFRLN